MDPTSQPNPIEQAMLAIDRARGLIAQDRASEAVFSLRQSHVALSDHPELQAEVAFLLGVALIDCGASDEGQRLVEQSVRWTREAGGPHPALPERLSALAAIHADSRRPRDAEGVHREAVEAARQLHGEHSAEVAERYAALASLLLRSSRGQEALGVLDVSAMLFRSTVGDSDPRTRQVVITLVDLLLEAGRMAIERRDRQLAHACVDRALAVAVDVLGPEDGRVHRARELAERL